jgi:O-antigen/teichoic acid export membrane protein
MSKLSRNILYNLAGQAASLVLGFVAVRFVYRQLGSDAVGIIFFALTLNTVITASMDLGISSTVVREVAASRGSSNTHIIGLLRTASLFYWSSYVLLAFLLVIVSGPIVSSWLNVGSLATPTALTSFRILCIGALLALPRSLYSSLFVGLQKMDINNAVDATATAIQQAGVAALIAFGGDIIAVSWWLAGSTAAGVVAYIVAASRVVSSRALIPSIDWRALRANRGYASRMTFVSVLAVVHTHADKLISSRLLPLGIFGLYGFGFNALNKGMLVTGAVAEAAFPSLSELERSGDRQGLLDQYQRLQEVVCYTAAPIFALTPFAVPPVFDWLFGHVEASQMLLACTILGLGFYMNAALNMPYMVSLAMGKPEIALSSNLLALVAVLPVTVLLVWRFGVAGAASSWVVYHVFAYLYAVPRICQECTGEQVRVWFTRVLNFAVLAVMVYGPLWIAVAVTNRSPLRLVLAYAAGTVIYATLASRTLSVGVRDRLRSILRKGPLSAIYGL